MCQCLCVSHLCLCVVTVYIQTQSLGPPSSLSREKTESEQEIKEYPTCRNNFLPAGQIVCECVCERETEREGKKTLVENREEVSGCSQHDFIPACIT